MRNLAIVVALVCSLAIRADADQCQLVDADVADWAVKLLARGLSYVAFCEPCGDAKPTTTSTISTVDNRRDHDSHQILVNNKEVDLAYLFVQTGKTTYTNVALMTGCPTQQVSSTITIKPRLLRPAQWSKRLPNACRDYERMMKKLAQCDKLPQASRDALQQGFEAMSDAWAEVDKLPADALKAMADACRTGADALKQTADAVGCAY